MDAEDSLFYYEKKFDELEFTRLATQQHILAGFDEFPLRLKEFVQLIHSHAQEPHPKYYALLGPTSDPSSDISSPPALNFTIYENNTFKQISLISFFLTPVSEEAIKTRLVDMNKRFKNELFTIQNRLLDTERSLTEQLKLSQHEKSTFYEELNQTKKSLDEHIKNISKTLNIPQGPTEQTVCILREKFKISAF